MPNMKTQTAAHTPKQGICPESSPELIRALKDILSHSYMPDAHTAFIVRAVNAHEELVEALREIAKGAGPYSQDQLEHATNTIQAMKDLANEAIAEQWGNA